MRRVLYFVIVLLSSRVLYRVFKKGLAKIIKQQQMAEAAERRRQEEAAAAEKAKSEAAAAAEFDRKLSKGEKNDVEN